MAFCLPRKKQKPEKKKLCLAKTKLWHATFAASPYRQLNEAGQRLVTIKLLGFRLGPEQPGVGDEEEVLAFLMVEGDDALPAWLKRHHEPLATFEEVLRGECEAQAVLVGQGLCDFKALK